jgi:hypothetical protein
MSDSNELDSFRKLDTKKAKEAARETENGMGPQSGSC